MFWRSRCCNRRVCVGVALISQSAAVGVLISFQSGVPIYTCVLLVGLWLGGSLPANFPGLNKCTKMCMSANQ